MLFYLYIIYILFIYYLYIISVYIIYISQEFDHSITTIQKAVYFKNCCGQGAAACIAPRHSIKYDKKKGKWVLTQKCAEHFLGKPHHSQIGAYCEKHPKIAIKWRYIFIHYFYYIFTLFLHYFYVICREKIYKFIDEWKDRRCELLKKERPQCYIEYEPRVQKATNDRGEPIQFTNHYIQYDGPEANTCGVPKVYCEWKQDFWVKNETSNHSHLKEIHEPITKDNPEKYANNEEFSKQNRSQIDKFAITDLKMNWGLWKGIISILFVYYFYIIYI